MTGGIRSFIRRQTRRWFIRNHPVRTVRQFALPSHESSLNYRYRTIGLDGYSSIQVHKLRDLTVHTEDGFLGLKHRNYEAILEESADIRIEKFLHRERRNIIDMTAPRRRVSYDEPVFVLNNPFSGGNYYHFVFDNLLRLLFLLELGERNFRILSTRQLPKFCHDYISIIAGLYDLEVEMVDLSQPLTIESETFVVGPYRYLAGNFPIYPMSFVNDLPKLITDHERFQPSNIRQPGGMVLICRTHNRVFGNEAEVLSRLPGLRRAVLDDMSVEEQIMLFNSADVLIGVHGAAMGNMIYSRAETPIIMLVPENFDHFENDVFHFLADARDQLLQVVHCGPIHGGKHDQGSCFKVDIDALSATLDAAVANG